MKFDEKNVKKNQKPYTLLYNDDDDTEDEEEFENMVLFYEFVSSRRYINERAPIPKSLEFCNAIFNYPDDAFRTIAR